MNLAALLLFGVKGTVPGRIAVPMAAAKVVGARLAVKRGDGFVRVLVLLVVVLLVTKMAYDLLR